MPLDTAKSHRLLATVGIACAAALVVTIWMNWHGSAKQMEPAVAAAGEPISQAVSAQGRFAPMEPVTHVGAPYIQGHPATIAKVAVAEGDIVHVGQLIAVLDGGEQLKAAVQEAAARVAEQQVKLKEAQEAPRPSEIAANEADVERSREAARTAESEFERYKSLRETRDVSASELQDKRNQMIGAQQMLAAARARQAALTEHHDQDVRAAQSALDAARAQLERARLDDASAEVHAPVDGVILHVRARAGEQAGPEGIVELARTAKMDVLAEIYETDINRVRMGEHAQVSSNLLPKGTKLDGTVVDIGREIGGAAMPAGGPAAFADARVVLVRVRLADGALASNLIGGKVSVVLQP